MLLREPLPEPLCECTAASVIHNLYQAGGEPISNQNIISAPQTRSDRVFIDGKQRYLLVQRDLPVQGQTGKEVPRLAARTGLQFSMPALSAPITVSSMKRHIQMAFYHAVLPVASARRT